MAETDLSEKLRKTKFEVLTLLKLNLEIVFLESNFFPEVELKNFIFADI